MEAVFAAVYLDGGITAASALIHQCLLDAEKEEAVEERRRDYKTALQELVQRQADQVLVYQVVGEQGPDHAKTFEAEVLLNGYAAWHRLRTQQKRSRTGCGEKRIGSVGT